MSQENTTSDSGNSPRCGFCGKPHTEVAQLVAGLGAYICDTCIDRCHDILNKELPHRAARTGHPFESLKKDYQQLVTLRQSGTIRGGVKVFL